MTASIVASATPVYSSLSVSLLVLIDRPTLFYYLDNNDLVGSIPEELGDAPALQYFWAGKFFHFVLGIGGTV